MHCRNGSRLLNSWKSRAAMPISGLVITLADDAARRDAALVALRQHAAITLGTQADARLPVVVETASDDEDRQVWEWMHSLPGVMQVDVALIHFEEADGL
jgi:nitrate reductase NapAB chaperone NapD